MTIICSDLFFAGVLYCIWMTAPASNVCITAPVHIRDVHTTLRLIPYEPVPTSVRVPACLYACLPAFVSVCRRARLRCASLLHGMSCMMLHGTARMMTSAGEDGTVWLGREFRLFRHASASQTTKATNTNTAAVVATAIATIITVVIVMGTVLAKVTQRVAVVGAGG